MKKKFTLFAKISGLTIGISILIIIFISYIFIGINERTLSLTIKNYYLSIIDDISNTITNHYQFIVEDLSKYLTIMNNDKIDIQEKIDLISLEITHSQLVDYVIVYEKNGELLDIFMAKEQELPFDKPKAVPKTVREKLLEKSAFIGTPLPDENNRYYSFVVIPWYKNDVLIGYLATYYDMENITLFVENVTLKRFNTENNIYVINCHYQSVLGQSTEELNLKKDNLFKCDKTLEDFILSQQTNIAITNIYQKGEERTLTSYKIFPDFKIIVGVEQPYDVAFKSINDLKQLTIKIAIAIVIITLFISLFFSRQLTSPLQKLNKLIRQLTSEKNFGQTVEIKTNDEINNLADNFNKLSVELDNYSKTIEQDTIIKSNLSRFLSPQIVEQIINRQEEISFQSKEREIAVLFADIHNFTLISEILDPSEVMDILNYFFSKSAKIIYKHNGTVDKYIGDCIMALFNTPYKVKDPAIVAARSAVDICNLMQPISEKFTDLLAKTPFKEITVGIGISYGKAVVGNVGSSEVMNYTAIGDTVNISSNLQRLAKGNNEILIDKNIYEDIKSEFTCEFHLRVNLKHRVHQTQVYRIIH